MRGGRFHAAGHWCLGLSMRMSQRFVPGACGWEGITELFFRLDVLRVLR